MVLHPIQEELYKNENFDKLLKETKLLNRLQGKAGLQHHL